MFGIIKVTTIATATVGVLTGAGYGLYRAGKWAFTKKVVVQTKA